MVHGHQLDGLAPQQPHAVQLAAIEDQAAEPHVVGGGADQPAAARGQRRRGREAAALRRVDLARLAVAATHVIRREAAELVGGHEEVRVHHAERRQHALAQEALEALPGDDGHQMAEHVSGDAVVPLRTGLRQQRQRRRLLDNLAQRCLRRLEIDAGLPIQRVHRRLVHEPIGQAGGVRQQVAEGDVAHRRYGLEQRLVAAGIDAHVAERRQEAGDRVVELKPAFLGTAS